MAVTPVTATPAPTPTTDATPSQTLTPTQTEQINASGASTFINALLPTLLTSYQKLVQDKLNDKS